MIIKKAISIFIIIAVLKQSYFSQTKVDVAETTLKIEGLVGEEVFYYGFAEGDQLVFNFEEMNGKELKEIEITELPSSSKFVDYKTHRIENKILNINRTGIFKFRFTNTALMGRVCKIKIQRMPATEATKNFNTTVYWKTVYDTSYTNEQEKYLVKADTIISNITDQVAKVHSVGNVNGNKTTFNFTLPDNTVAWSYYVGVEQAGQESYQKAASELATHATPFVSKIPGYGPLAALALGGISYLSALQSGEDIDFYIVNGDNVNAFISGQQFYYLKNGKVINDYSRMLKPLTGSYYVCLSNDNAVTGVSVAVKITAIIVKEQWGQRNVKRINTSSRQEAYLKN